MVPSKKRSFTAVSRERTPGFGFCRVFWARPRRTGEVLFVTMKGVETGVASA